MDQNQNPSLFGLNVDATGQSHLGEAARWGKFLAIVGMVMCVLIVVFGIIAATAISSLDNSFRRSGFGDSPYDSAGMGVTMVVTYIFIAVIYFFPCMFMLRFSNHMQNALKANDLNSLNESFKNLKVTFRYMGILTIIGLVFFVLALLIGGLGVLMGG
jgi:magnesium-transporting ATPase (P-type)